MDSLLSEITTDLVFKSPEGFKSESKLEVLTKTTEERLKYILGQSLRQKSGITNIKDYEEGKREVIELIVSQAPSVIKLLEVYINDQSSLLG